MRSDDRFGFKSSRYSCRRQDATTTLIIDIAHRGGISVSERTKISVWLDLQAGRCETPCAALYGPQAVVTP